MNWKQRLVRFLCFLVIIEALVLVWVNESVPEEGAHEAQRGQQHAQAGARRRVLLFLNALANLGLLRSSQRMLLVQMRVKYIH